MVEEKKEIEVVEEGVSELISNIVRGCGIGLFKRKCGKTICGEIFGGKLRLCLACKSKFEAYQNVEKIIKNIKEKRK